MKYYYHLELDNHEIVFNTKVELNFLNIKSTISY